MALRPKLGKRTSTANCNCASAFPNTCDCLGLTCQTDLNLPEAGAAPEEVLRDFKPGLPGTNKPEHLKVKIPYNEVTNCQSTRA